MRFIRFLAKLFSLAVLGCVLFYVFAYLAFSLLIPEPYYSESRFLLESVDRLPLDFLVVGALAGTVMLIVREFLGYDDPHRGFAYYLGTVLGTLGFGMFLADATAFEWTRFIGPTLITSGLVAIFMTLDFSRGFRVLALAFLAVFCGIWTFELEDSMRPKAPDAPVADTVHF